MAGVNIINIYTSTIFEDIALKGAKSSLSPKTQTYFIGISGFVGAILAAFSVQNLTRRQIFIGGHSIIGVCMLLIGLFDDLNSPNPLLFFMCIAIIIYQCSLGSVFWIYASEVCTDAALGVCVFLMFGILALQSTLFITVLKAIGVGSTFYVFGGF